MEQNILIGKTIEKVFIAEDKMAMKFVVKDSEDVIVKTDGDCCSHSYIEHVEFSQIFPATVSSVEEIDMDRLPEGEWGDVTQCYGCKIHTDKGIFFIEYRNDSNGYYGGNLSWPNDGYFYGGVHGQNVSNEKWVELSEDF